MLTHALRMQSHDSIYRNTQWSPQQKGVLTDLLSEHDFKYVCADAISRMLTYALSRMLTYTDLLSEHDFKYVHLCACRML